MRHVVRCVSFACLAAGMLTASVQAGPIFALKIVEKNGVNLRTCDGGVNVGLSCVAGRTRCVGGDLPGIECLGDINCTGGGSCDPDCPGFGVSCIGVDDIDADPTDVLVLDASVRGFDENVFEGRCFGDGQEDPPCRRDSQCSGKHCTNSGSSCLNNSSCNAGAECVLNLCDPYPTVGAFQWTIDGENSYISGAAGSLFPYILEIGDLPCQGVCIGGDNDGDPCTNFFDCFAGGGVCSENALNDICRHGALFGTQCTCFLSGCDEEAGVCDLQSTAYIQLSRQDYLHAGGQSLVAVSTNGDNWIWGGTLQDLFDPLIADEGVHYYLGTLWLTSTTDACGTFSVDMMDHPALTWLTRFNLTDLTGATREGVTINFPLPCDPTCPDGSCNGDETACDCPEDCPDACGDGCCTGAENGGNCPQDCGCDVNYVSSVPDASDVGEDATRPGGTLWRTEKNVIRITLDGPADGAPNAGDIEIRELQNDGAFGPDLSATFEFSMEDGDTVLRIKDTGSTILHQKWYAIINVSWASVCEFERHYASAYGDGNGDGLVQFADLAFINSMINQDPVSPDADRHDINGDNLIQFADLAAANATINLHASAKPTGH